MSLTESLIPQGLKMEKSHESRSLRLLPARMRPPSEEGGSEGSGGGGAGVHRQAELRVREGESLRKGSWGARVGEEPRPWPPGLYALPLCL